MSLNEEISREGQFEPIRLSGVEGSCDCSVGASLSMTAGGSQWAMWLCA